MTAKIAKMGGILLLFAACFGAAAYLSLTWFVGKDKGIVVPNLVGRETVHALEILSDLGLNTRVQGFEYSDTVPKDHVIYQETTPGAIVKPGRDIRITISRGTRKVTVPNLRGLPIEQASLILAENDLETGTIASTYRSDMPLGKIIAQTPESMRRVNRKEKVNLLKSAGPFRRIYKMPDLNRQTMGETAEYLDRINLTLGKIHARYKPSEPKSVIIDQKPIPGYAITEGSAVELVINQAEPFEKSTRLDRFRGVKLFSYRIPNGFLKRHIRLQINIFGISTDLVNDYFHPGERIRAIIPSDTEASLLLYEDTELKMTRVFEPG